MEYKCPIHDKASNIMCNPKECEYTSDLVLDQIHVWAGQWQLGQRQQFTAHNVPVEGFVNETMRVKLCSAAVAATPTHRETDQ
jgi:hypothetical protein